MGPWYGRNAMPEQMACRRRVLIGVPYSCVTQILKTLGVNVNFVIRTAGESFQLFNNDPLGAMAAIQKGGNYRNTHASRREVACPEREPERWRTAPKGAMSVNGTKSRAS